MGNSHHGTTYTQTASRAKGESYKSVNVGVTKETTLTKLVSKKRQKGLKR